jgi:hypothetical protein
MNLKRKLIAWAAILYAVSLLAQVPSAPANLRPTKPSLEFANGGPDDNANFCWMGRTNVATQAGLIYRLESSLDLVTWELLPPEIDGTGQVEAFYDAMDLGGDKHYRIETRPGVLPP